MNIEQAKAIAITEILKILNVKPSWENNIGAMYLSPIREERTPSFYVDKIKNTWFDYGIAEGGDVIDFVREYLKYCKENHNVSDALRWIENMSGNAPSIKPVVGLPIPKEKNLLLKSAQPLGHPALINYLEDRGIPLKVAMHYLEKVSVLNKSTGKTITALGFKNDNDGYELRNRAFKGCLEPKYITFIRGAIPKPPGIHVFEGFMDFLTVIMMNDGCPFNDDAIVLNSLVCLNKATPYIKDYGYKFAYTWMDNDIAGKKATVELSEFFKTQEDIQHKPMNAVYKAHKDVNAWHMHNLNLSL